MSGTAPYNFVRFTDSIIPSAALVGDLEVSDGTLNNHHDEVVGYSGHIDLQIQALTPLYIGRDRAEQTTRAAYSLQWPVGGDLAPAWIPGSSVAGVYRSILAELFGDWIDYEEHKSPVYDRQPYHDPKIGAERVREDEYFRARGRTGVNDSPVGVLATNGHGGFIVYECTKVKVSWELLSKCGFDIRTSTLKEIRDKYQFASVHFQDERSEFGLEATQIDVKNTTKPSTGWKAGWLLITGVTKSNINANPISGNQKNRQHHAFIVVAPSPKAINHKVSDKCIKELKELNTNLSIGIPNHVTSSYQIETLPTAIITLALKGKKILPVFYDLSNGEVSRVGFSGGFRIAGSSLQSLLPSSVKGRSSFKNGGEVSALESLVGVVVEASGEVEGKAEDRGLSVASRVQFGDFLSPLKDSETPFEDEGPGAGTSRNMLSMLGPNPKAHHLRLNNNNPYYAPGENNGIRGREVYLHRWDTKTTWRSACGDHRNLLNDKDEDDSKTATEYRPLKAGALFNGRIRFKNLSPLELGALVFATWLANPIGQTIGDDPVSAHKIGGLKPLGLGSVSMAGELFVEDPLNEVEGWESFKNSRLAKPNNSLASSLRREFVNWYQNSSRLSVETLLDVLRATSWKNRPTRAQTAEMTVDQHRSRPKLDYLHAIRPEFQSSEIMKLLKNL